MTNILYRCLQLLLPFRLHDPPGAIESAQRQRNGSDRLNIRGTSKLPWTYRGGLRTIQLPYQIMMKKQMDLDSWFKLCSETFLARQSHARDTCALK